MTKMMQRPATLQAYSNNMYHSVQPFHVQQQLERQSHFFIVILGALIGASLALCVAYHWADHVLSYLALAIIPIVLSYSLRKVYIYTLSQCQYD